MLKRIRAIRRPLVGGVVAALASVILAMAMPPQWREIAVAQAEDAIMRASMPFRTVPPIRPAIVVVEIDSASLQDIGPWPWPRETLARLVAAASASKPAVLALDMLLAESDPRSPLAELRRRGVTIDPGAMASLTRALPDGDLALAEALREVPGVLGLVLDTAKAGHAPVAPILTRGQPDVQPMWKGAGVIGPHDVLQRGISGLGIIALPGDADGNIRRLPLFVEAAGTPYPGLALEILRIWQDASAFLVQGPPTEILIGDFQVRLPSSAMLRLVPDFAGGDAISHLKASAVLSGSARIAPGSIVLIGGSAPELGGLRAIQSDALIPTVTVQARAVAQLLAGITPLQPAFADIILAGLLLMACTLAIWAARAVGPVPGILLLGACLGVLIGASMAAFVAGNWLLAPLLPAVAATAAFVGASVTTYVEARRREARIRHRFEQHLAPQVVSMIVANPGLIKLRGEKREITALFTDVEGFTPMTERAEPEKLIRVLDEYFEGLAGIVVRHGGMVDKIVGDAVHAMFNAPLDQPDHATKAFMAAREIALWSAEFRSRALPGEIGFGRTRIGVETGIAIVGDVGIRSKLDYTAHGIVVNSAARLEAANKLFGSTICLGPVIASRVPPDALRPLGEIQLRGFSNVVRVFEPWPDTAPPEWRRRYVDAVAKAKADSGSARALFKALADELPGDMVCRQQAGDHPISEIRQP